ncbi:tRNA (N6-isopentenyl adenosine(37)-C2)-methylthiotransferase MiaB [Candidatus Calescamantes bacterium]|nr:tRNA (N6-isopentenyl adenosine(37)-C2)-methylthiotransferase MiaB [Candidatus Calescamantes bacterium]
MRFYIETYGCQMNQYDSRVVSSLLEREGWEKVDEWKEADFILVNTCAVRQHAEDRVFSRLGIWGKYKREKKPSLKIGILGCISQKEGENLIHRFPYLDLVAGTFVIPKISQLVKEALEHRVVALEEELLEIPPPEIEEDAVTTFISVMRGCNNFCSYCIVPYVRGRERSRSPESVIEEVKKAVSKGVKEVVLLGQNVNSYRGFSVRDGRCVDFPELLKLVNKVEGLYRIRFATSHPKDLSDELIKAVKELDKVCEHIHLPIQSGSNRILQLMNRKYTREDYLRLVEKIRKEIPEVSITTDIIVGFPGEGEKEFMETVSLVKEVEFDAAYIFKYSPRPFTSAYSLKDDVSKEEKERRLNYLLQLQKSISKKKNDIYVGKEVEVLVEKREREGWFGRTRNHKSVIISSSLPLLGKLVKVRIVRNRKGILEGYFR